MPNTGLDSPTLSGTSETIDHTAGHPGGIGVDTLKQRFSFTRTPVTISIALIVAALSVVLFLGLTTLNRVDIIQADWNDYKAEAGSKGFYLSQIRRGLGYGGLIHHFKNYVLQHDTAEMRQAQEELAALREAIYGFRSTTDVQEELEALDEISAISITYVRNLAVAQRLHGEGKSPTEVDVAVRIDDAPAIAALALLESSWLNTGVRARDASGAALEEVQVQSVVLAVARIIIVFAGVALVLFLRRDATEKDRVNKALQETMLRAQQMERQQSQSEKRIRSILDTAAVGMITINEKGTIESFNPKAEEIFGYTKKEIIGRPVTTLMLDPHKSHHDLYIDKYNETGVGQILGVAPRELMGLRKDGSEFNIELTIAEMMVNDQRFFVGSVLDISERKGTEEQLRQSQRMEAVGQLTGGVAHDFNNILMGMQLNLELLQPDISESEANKGSVDTLLRSIGRAADLTGQLLAFSRKLALRPEVTDVEARIEESTALLRRTLTANIEIETVAAGDLWRALVDPGQLEAALLNLALNARDAMPKGGTLCIETANQTLSGEDVERLEDVTPGDYVEVSVSDTGTGMAQDTLDKVFEPFFTTKDVGEGSGLGLSMVHGFVRQSGGYVALDSTVGEGTAVKMYFPRAEEATEGVTKEAVTIATPTGGEAILIVEDDQAVRHSVARSLQSLGYEVIQAEHGPEAIKLIDFGAVPDLLLTDIVMPEGMDGLAVSARVRELLPQCRVVYMTGYAETAVELQSDPDRQAIVLKKPYTMQALAQTVREALDGPEG